ncbi:MAG TPA: cytochrome B6, partial [Polyangia bacterium]|nr:cytochrome B6 [Polyangia bacterium]
MRSGILIVGLIVVSAAAFAAAPVASAAFTAMKNKKSDARPTVMKRARDLLAARYDLSGRTDSTTRMSGGKRIPVGPTARLPKGASWDALARMSPEEIKQRG